LNELLGRSDARDLRLKCTPDPEYVLGPFMCRFKHDPTRLGNGERLALLNNQAVTGKELEGKSKLMLEGGGVIDRVGGVQNVSQSGSIEVGEVDGQEDPRDSTCIGLIHAA
jgi:hypothetical protein